MPRAGVAKSANETRQTYRLATDVAFAEAMRTRREEMGWTQYQLVKRLNAEGLGYHQTTVSRIEKGQQQVYLGSALVIARVLGIGIDELNGSVRADGGFSAGYRAGVEAAQKAVAEL